MNIVTVEAERESTARVLGDVAAERANQDAQWGGPGHDDRHTTVDWRFYRRKFELRAMTNIHDPARARDALVKIAALAVAQIEALDRIAARKAAHD